MIRRNKIRYKHQQTITILRNGKVENLSPPYTPSQARKFIQKKSNKDG